MNAEQFQIFKNAALNSVINHITNSEIEDLIVSYRKNGWVNGAIQSMYFKAMVLQYETMYMALRAMAYAIIEEYGMYPDDSVKVHDDERYYDGTFLSFTATSDEFYISVLESEPDGEIYDIPFNPDNISLVYECEH
jgi:hypothetical protein